MTGREVCCGTTCDKAKLEAQLKAEGAQEFFRFVVNGYIKGDYTLMKCLKDYQLSLGIENINGDKEKWY